MQSHIPTHTVGGKRKQKHQSYMDGQGMRFLKAKQRAWQKYTESHDLYDYQRYCTIRNKLRSHTRNLRQEFEEALADETKTNPKAFWKYTKTKLTVKSGVSDLKDNGGTVQTENSAKAEVLNEFFSSVFTKEDTSSVPNLERKTANSELLDISITEESILKRLQNLKGSKSSGPDGFHPRVLKEIAPAIVKPLRLIYSKSVESGILPSQWKQGQITPIFKKGDRSEPGNYRPVSLTSVLCKVLEALIREQVMSHMVDNDLFCDEQHGFVPSRSCMTQLITCIDDWTEALDRGEPLDAIYLDFKKAFDTVPHERLVKKLQSYGIDGRVRAWITSFLQGRSQRVSINGHTSGWTEVTSGIPQGSVLGPVLFVIFINDLPDVVQTVVRIFADDTKMYGPASSAEDVEKLQEDIEKLSDWSERWQLKFNTDKCSVMHIGHNNPRHTYQMRDNDGNYKELKESKIEKDLGVYVDDKLTFHQHVNQAVAKANRTLGVIKRTFASRDKKIVKKLYTTMVRPILEYGNAPRIHQYAGDIDKLERVQRRATRLCTEVKDLPYEERLRALRLPSLYYRRDRGDMIQTYKILTGRDNVDQEKILPLNHASRTRGNSKKLAKQHGRLNIRKFSFGLRTVNCWNALPESVISAKSTNDFKNKLDKHWRLRQYTTRPMHATTSLETRRHERESQA